MSDLRLEIVADSSAAERSIKALKAEIKGVKKEFENAEIAQEDFIAAAGNLSGLQKELKDARSAVVDIDGAYKKLSQTMAQFRSGMGARGAIPNVASPVRGTAQQFGSPEYFDALNRNLEKAINEGRQLDAEIAQAANSRQQAISNFRAGMGAQGASWVASSVQGTPQQFGSPAYFDALNKDLKRAIDEGRQLDAEIKRAAESREQAIMEFRSGMGAKGAIPAVASPIRGGIEYGPANGSPGSPAYLEEVAKATKRVQQELDDAAEAAGTIAPRVEAFQPLSLAAYEAKLKVLKKEARLISPSDVKWKQLNKQILQAERGVGKINKMQKLGPTAGQRAGAAGGAFLYGGGMGGGVGSAVGGVVGGLMGGPGPAFAGAAIGQAVDNLGTALAGITSQAAAVQKMQRGLAMASVDAKDFAEAQAAVGEMSQKLLMPLEQTTKYFAQLRANTKEYNLSVAETRQILEGTALAIMATGGSAEDLDGAMRAVVQIMSKGGVQAEELRGQLGERFPGAVVKFAQANKMSFEELQAGLEAGEIGIREFINFAKKNYTDYAKFSEQLATAPEYAGQRLKIALEQISLEIGSLFGPVGADIQDALTEAINGISSFVKENRVYMRQFISDFGSIVGPIVKIFAQLLGVVAKFSVEVGKVFQGLYSNIRQALGMATIGEAKARLDRAKAATKGQTRPEGNVRGGGGFTELDQAQQAFNALGGQAAFDKANAPAQPTNLTFGGAGAGMSIDRTGKEEKDKDSKLKEFNNDRTRILQERLAAEKAAIDADLLLSERERSIEKGRLDFKYGNQIIDEQLVQARRTSQEYQLKDRARFIAEQEQLAAIERKTLESQFVIGIAPELSQGYQSLLDTYDSLILEQEALTRGKDELTEAEKVEILLARIRAGLQPAELARVDELAGAYLAQAKAVDILSASNQKQLALREALEPLQQQLQLAQILDPRAELRAQIKQEQPKLDDEGVEQIARLQEQVNAAQKLKADLQGIASTIGNAFGEAFKGIITGTMSVREALGGLFQSIADSFADMVAQMIAEWLKAQLIQGFQSLFSAVLPGLGAAAGGLSSGFSAGTSSAIDTGAAGWASSFATPLKFANGGIASGGFRAFASGGIVTGPTLGLVGEGRYNEAVIPLPDGKSVPVDLGGMAGGMGGEVTSNIVVNINNGQMQGNGNGNGSELGRKIEGAVKQVLVSELRPGGILSSGRR
jgi:tape measure domain-containing protein